MELNGWTAISQALCILILLTHIRTVSPLFLKPQEMSLNILIFYNPPLPAGGGGDASPASITLGIRGNKVSEPEHAPSLPVLPRARGPMERIGSPQSQRDGEEGTHATNWPETLVE